MADDKKKVENSARILPRSELDLNLLLTNGVWGSENISEDLKEKLRRYYKTQNEKGETKITYDSLWGLLSFYTRDLRLANLSSNRGEVAYCQYYLDLAADLLQVDMVEPFLICLSRAASMLELSQSKGGFLRRRMNTLSQEHINQEIEPKKKSLFGKGMEGES